MSPSATRRVRRHIMNVVLVVLGLAAKTWMDRHRPNLAATWDLASPMAPTTQARIRVIDREWVERDSLIGGSGWLRPRTVGELTMPIDDRRAAAGGGTP